MAGLKSGVGLLVIKNARLILYLSDMLIFRNLKFYAFIKAFLNVSLGRRQQNSTKLVRIFVVKGVEMDATISQFIPSL
jgi:hypothetical protein